MVKMDLDDIIASNISTLENMKVLVNLKPALVDENDAQRADYAKLAKSSVLIASLIKEFKEEAELSRRNSAEMKSLTEEMATLTQQSESLIDKIPKYLPSKQHDVSQSENVAPRPEVSSFAKKGQGTSARSAHGTSGKTSKIPPPPQLAYITSNEFTSVPAYMRGRISYSDANKAIDIINHTAVEKYKIVRKTKGLTDYQRRKKMEFLDMEMKETANVHFITDQDITELSSTKIDKSFLSLFPILRHCGRLRHIRAGKITKYVLLAGPQ